MDILQWNLNGYYRRKQFLQLALNKFNPSVICLQETNFKDNQCAQLTGFQATFKNRTNTCNASGGVAIYTKSTIFYKEIPLNSKYEATAVQINYPSTITICNVYLPNSSKLEINELTNLSNQIPKPCIILGDFNSHNKIWGSKLTDQRGKIVEDWLNSQDDLVILNDGQPTHFNVSNASSSAIDLTIISTELLLNFTWQPADNTYDSDHYPIMTKYLNNPHQEESSHPKWILEKANWRLYQEIIETGLPELLDPVNITGPSLIYSNNLLYNFNSLIISAANSAIPRTTGNKKAPKKIPWLDSICRDQITNYKKMFRKYKKSQNESDKIQFKIARAKARRSIKEKAKQTWNNFTLSITSSTPTGVVWKKIKQISNKPTSQYPPVIEDNHHNRATSTIDKCNVLAKSFAENSSNLQINSSTNSSTVLGILPTTHNEEPINGPITMDELKFTLANSNNSSPGPDDIPNSFIKNLPDSGIKYLLSLYNFIWLNQSFPDLWREAIVIPIPKPKKDISKASNYRPISLTCNLCKILEKIIGRRLRWKLESEQLISPNQSGFREFRSTLDHLGSIEEEICSAFANQLHLILVSMDLEKAYETVPTAKVIQTCVELGLKGNTLAFISNFLSGRKLKVRINDQLSDSVELEKGLPQGSVMSVILFIIIINNILTEVKKPVKALLFADDLSILCSGRNIETTQKLIQSALEAVNNWAKSNGLKFSSTKTTYTIFSRSYKVIEPIELTLENHPLIRTNSTKILGLTFDSKLTWKNHIEDLILDCKKRINILKVLSSTKWGADQESLIRVYRGLIRSKIDYGSIIYGSANSNLLKKLDAIQNAALRISLGVFRTTPVYSILAEAQEKPLDLRRMELTITYANKIMASPENPMNATLFHSSANNSYKTHLRLPRPLKIRLQDYLSLLRMELILMHNRKNHPLPPWTPQKIPIRMELIQHHRETTSSQVYKMLFMEIKSQYDGSRFYFTDGSLIDGQTGCAITTETEDCESTRLPSQYSIFSCELYAIFSTLSLIERSQSTSNAVICSDSFSSLTALKNPFSSNPLVQAIQVLVKNLQDREISIELIWIPAHQGIVGNERADALAKKATTSPILDNNIPVILQEAKKHYSTVINNFWNIKWKSVKTHLQLIRQDIHSARPPIPSNRRDQCTITRLRTGHINASHLHRITKETPRSCNLCGQALNVLHILVECTHLSIARRKINIPGSISSNLINTDACLRTLKFIKAINATQFI